MKRFFSLVALFGLLLLSQGTANAVLGVEDNVPGTDQVTPFICEKGGTLNTLFAVAEVWGNPVTADLVVFDRSSNVIYDDVVDLTEFDVLPMDCQSLVAGMSNAQRTALEVTIGGKTYYAGYLGIFNLDYPDYDQLISWAYLVDLPKGFASGFNGLSFEGYATGQLCEYDSDAGAPVCSYAILFYPRYLLLNDKPDTFNWWIFLYGDNEINRVLTGYICNEEEDCISLSIPVSKELNVVNVSDVLPAALHTGYPKAGFGWLINAEADYDNGAFGWSYQRAQGNSVAGTWDVIHPIHKYY